MNAWRDDNEEALPANMIRWRYMAVLLFFACILGLIIGRLVMLHAVDQEFLFHEGEKRSVRAIPEPAHRGDILDRQGRPLAVSTEVVEIGLHPLRVDLAQLPEMARIMKLDPNALVARVKRSAKASQNFIYIDRLVEPGVADKVEALGIKGLQLQRRAHRYYPAAEVASHLVGIVDIDHQGQEGLELAYDQYLSGTPGKRTVLKDNRGQVIKQLRLDEAAKPGDDLQLTIDLRLQYLAYRELLAAVNEHKAKTGSAVLLDAKTSEVLALVNQPSYNPNNRRELKPGSMRNRALADVIEPGSTMKPFTVAAALESGRYRPDSVLDTSPGYLRVRSKTIRDHRDYGQLDLTGVITKSSNVGATLLSKDLGAEAVWSFFHAAGMGTASGLGFPGESVGSLPYPEQMDSLRLATVSYGYGMAVSPLQLAQAYTSFTQNGCRKPAVLVVGQQAGDCQPVMSSAVAHQMLNILETVTSNKGTGRRARVDGYRVGGKTGTAHKVGRGGYEDSAYTAVFVGTAPLTNPDLVLVVVVDEPQGREYYGGEVAAPVFSRIMEQALRIRQVAPDDLSGIEVQVAGGAR
ncbi:MAG: peptidoglycan D,D-transpeptidase FtsI family protein [Oceanobacter sp.]